MINSKTFHPKSKFFTTLDLIAITTVQQCMHRGDFESELKVKLRGHGVARFDNLSSFDG